MEQIRQLQTIRDEAWTRIKATPDYKLASSLDALIADLQEAMSETGEEGSDEPEGDEPADEEGGEPVSPAAEPTDSAPGSDDDQTPFLMAEAMGAETTEAEDLGLDEDEAGVAQALSPQSDESSAGAADGVGEAIETVVEETFEQTVEVPLPDSADGGASEVESEPPEPAEEPADGTEVAQGAEAEDIETLSDDEERETILKEFSQMIHSGRPAAAAQEGDKDAIPELEAAMQNVDGDEPEPEQPAVSDEDDVFLKAAMQALDEDLANAGSSLLEEEAEEEKARGRSRKR